MRATREGRGGRAAPAETRGPGRRGHAELKARGHNAANPDDAGPLPFSFLFFSKRSYPHLGFQKCPGVINSTNKPDFSFPALFYFIFFAFLKITNDATFKIFFFFLML